MFVSTPSPLPPNAQLLAEVRSKESTLLVRAVSIHALRTPTRLQAVKPSGMGVRFLEGGDLDRLRELVRSL